MTNVEMTELWNGRSADLWVAEAVRFDTMLAPFGRRLLEAAGLRPGQRVLDVGCGTGAVSLDAARAVAPAGSVTGIDLSDPMLGLARQRAEQQDSEVDVEFLSGDAQTARFDRSFDVVLSRFGVMFFDDPRAAFSNLARATRPGGRLCFVCWQEMFANEWLAVPALAAVGHLGVPELPEPGSPGPFSLADAEHTARLLESAGWTDISVEAHADEMQIGRDADDVVAFLLSDEMGRRLVDGKDQATVEAGTAAAVEAVRPYMGPEGVVMTGAYQVVIASTK
jgi:SAM-dependent methyltransferase